MSSLIYQFANYNTSLCPKCAYKCPCGAIHVTYCVTQGCDHNDTFKVPEKQTCEVWKDDVLLALVEDRPIPLLRDSLDPLLNPKSPYGSEYGVMLNGGIQVWRHENEIDEIHPDGTRYKWYNPAYLLNAFARGDSDTARLGSFIRVFGDGSFKARIEGRNYVWGPPVLRTMSSEIPMLRLNNEITIDYSKGTHPESCECAECIYATVTPVYYHKKDECICVSCNYIEEDEYCDSRCDGCIMCASDDDCTRSSVSSDSYMRGAKL